MQRPDIVVGDDRDPFAGQQRPHQRPGAGQQPAPDMNVIGPLAQRYVHGLGHSLSSRTSDRVSNVSITFSAIVSIA